MMTNSLIGSADILLLFFLQAKLPAAGIPEGWLGPALFIMELGGIVGAKLILKFKKHGYRTIFTVSGCLVLAGILLEHTGVPLEQRATLISIESFTFSIIMIVLSPLAGFFFSLW